MDYLEHGIILNIHGSATASPGLNLELPHSVLAGDLYLTESREVLLITGVYWAKLFISISAFSTRKGL